MNEIIFLVEEAPEGGYTARALGASIFTEADDLEQLHDQVRDAVLCHFEDEERPKLIRLHFVREDVIYLDGTEAGDWKLKVVSTGPVGVGGQAGEQKAVVKPAA